MGIRDMSLELEAMYAFLHKVSEVPRDQLDEQHKTWAKEVRDLSYDMEDMVDTFMVDVECPDGPSKSSFEKFFSKMKEKVNKALTRREIAEEIKDIKERVREVATRHERYKIDANTPPKITHVDLRITALYTDATKLVGIDEAKQELITRLTTGEDNQQQERIISIAGFGGLGKTTLAKAVYDEIKGQFECNAFVSVSRDPDTKKILKDILYELHKEEDGNNIILGANLVEIKHIIDLVHKSLQNKRYLIVIDDIWSIEPWKIILCALNIENNMGSRIIATTRIIGLAEQLGGCYRLKPLTNKNSEKLFNGRIFGEDNCPEHFSEVSKRILKKCGGVPLAIVTASSLLANKSENINDWYDVCNSIGSGLGSNPDIDSMRKILLLSYYDLPSHLKTCLLYLSIFPEDYEIEKGQLIWRWVAEGFVQRGQEDLQSFLGIGESYFNELVDRSLIKPADMDVDGTPKACHVHDMVLDLIISLSKEECFVTLGDWKHSLEGNKQVRRLSLHDDTTDWTTMNLPKLRSLTIFKPAALVIDPTPTLSCHLLRVLDLGGGKLKDLASLGFLGSLSHLRYLGLSSSTNSLGADQLPVEIGKLRFLQTLDLSGTMVGKLPWSLKGLKHLVCLRGGDIWRNIRLPYGLLKNLTSLEVLEWLIVTCESFAEELGHLTRLRALSIGVELFKEDRRSWQACGEAMVESLSKLQKIESLYVHRHRELFMDGSVEQPLRYLRRLHFQMIAALPTWINGVSLPALSYLYVVVQHERREDIQVLSTLPCLRRLTFHVTHRAEQALERSEVGPGAFPSAIACDLGATAFDLVYGTRVQSVVPSMFLGGAMAKLEDYTFTIDLDDFRGGGGAPYTVDDLALAHLTSLRSVDVRIFGTAGRMVRRSVRAKLRQEAAAHPNHPRLELRTF